MTDKENTAYLYNTGDITCFRYNGRTIKFKAPYSLEFYTGICDWDKESGCITVMAKYTDSEAPEEEYIDIKYILYLLYKDADEFLNPIENLEVEYDRS